MEYTLDQKIFLLLNFDGGHAMDVCMEAISGTILWIPLYLLVLYLIYKKYSWKGALSFFVLLFLAMGLSDMLCGIFKHVGLLGNVWPSFPARPRPMFTPGIAEHAHVYSFFHGPFGTVSSHAATVVTLAVMSISAIQKRWFSLMMIFIALLIIYSRIYLACHYPMDLLLGAIVGLVSGGLIYLLWRTLNRLIRKSEQVKN